MYLKRVLIYLESMYPKRVLKYLKSMYPKRVLFNPHRVYIFPKLTSIE